MPAVVSNHVSLRPWLLVAVALSIVATYCLLHITYDPANSDDAWTTSFAYNFFYRGELQDTVFGRPAGTVSAFGYSYAALQKFVLDTFGWTRSNAIWLSTCLFFLSLPFWWGISRNFGCDQSTSLLYIGVFPLWESLFRIANTARPDACCLLFVGIALFLAQKKRYIFAGIASGIAFEVHQMGVLAFLLVGIHFLFDFYEKYKDKKNIISLVVLWMTGIFLGISYYLYLHFAYMSETLHSINKMHSWNGNFIWSYFFITNTYRHVPVLLLIIISIIAAFRLNIVKQFRELFFITFAIIFFSFVFPRPNFYYSAYFFVFAVLIVSIVITRCGRENAFVLLFLCFILPQYGYIYLKNRSFDMHDFTASMQREVPESCKTLAGPFNAWFAFKDRHFLGSLPDMVPSVAGLVGSQPVCYLHRLDEQDPRDVMGRQFAIGNALKEFDAGGHRYGLYRLSEKQR